MKNLSAEQRHALGRTMALLKHWRRLIHSSKMFGPAEATKANLDWIEDVIQKMNRAFYLDEPPNYSKLKELLRGEPREEPEREG